MKKIVFSLSLISIWTTSVFSHDLNGTYKLYGWDVGNLVINGDRFDLEVRDNEPDTYCIVLKNGMIKETKGKVQVFKGNELFYTLRKKGKSIQLIPNPEVEIVRVCNGSKVSEEPVVGRVSVGYDQSVKDWKWEKVE